jgi:hypothetical protein
MSSPLAEVWPDFYLMHNFIRDQRISIQYYPIRKKKKLALQRTKRQTSHQKARQLFPFRILLGNSKESSLNMLR